MSGAWVILNIAVAVVTNLLPANDSSLWIMGLLLLASFAVQIYQGYRLGRVFGKSTGFCVFSAILMPIAMIILAFDNSEYIEPFDLEEDE